LTKLCLKLYPFNFCNNFVDHALILIIFGKKFASCGLEAYIHVIDSLNVLQLRTTLNVAGVVEDTWCSTLKVTVWLKIYINSKVMVLKIMNFLTNIDGLNYLLKKLQNTSTTAR